MTAIPAIMNRALDCHQSGRLVEAERLLRQVLVQQPEYADAWWRLGIIAYQVGRYPLAVKLVRRAIALKRDQGGYYLWLGKALHMVQQFDAAQAALQQALQLNPGDGDVLYHLGNALHARQDLAGAIDYYRQALRVKPDDAEIYCSLGLALRSASQFDEAIESYRQALRLRPEFMRAHCGLVSMLSYHVLCSTQDMLDEHRAWDRIQGREGREHGYTHSRDQDPDKRLRIAYVSPDFREHAVSYFIEPLLAAHDHAAVEVYCYAEVRHPDAVTARLQQYADVWRSTLGLSDADVARMIHGDQIDVLVDLTGHAHNGCSRIRAFTFRPAPIQATYLGYFSTTGLAAMDYWITDDVLHPVDTCELATETLWRLPRCCMAYLPPADAPDVGRHDVPGNPLTFACFNNIAKAGAETFSLWSEILARVPASRLLLKSRQLADERLCEDIRRQFTGHGVKPERIVMRPKTSGVREHLAMYDEADIALDVMPRTGGTTTMEALWMGVPVISLAGERFIERLSASMLTAVGLEALIATTPEEYIEKAVALAGDAGRRRVLHQSLRDRVAASPLADGRGLAQAMEQAYRQMWRDWLAPDDQ